MALITLEGIRFHAYHGVYEAERLVGAEYIVDITVKTVTSRAAEIDDLALTINYETIYQICQLEMAEPRKLLETVLEGIIARMKHQFSTMQVLRVRIKKTNPPFGGRVESAWVEETLDFIRSCPRCGRKFINYEDGDCWTRFPNLHPATRDMLTRQFKGACLCDECLKFYAG